MSIKYPDAPEFDPQRNPGYGYLNERRNFVLRTLNGTISSLFETISTLAIKIQRDQDEMRKVIAELTSIDKAIVEVRIWKDRPNKTIVNAFKTPSGCAILQFALDGVVAFTPNGIFYSSTLIECVELLGEECIQDFGLLASFPQYEFEIPPRGDEEQNQ